MTKKATKKIEVDFIEDTVVETVETESVEPVSIHPKDVMEINGNLYKVRKDANGVTYKDRL